MTSKNLDLFFMCVGESVSSTCMYVYHMCTGARGDQERKSDFMELELQMPVHHYAGAGNQTRVLCNKNKGLDHCVITLAPNCFF